MTVTDLALPVAGTPLELQVWSALSPVLTVAIVGYARIAPVCLLLPFSNQRVLSSVILRNLVIAMVAWGLWPVIEPIVPRAEAGLDVWVALLTREVGVGLAIGVTLVMPFWILIGVGEIIDNQRGATISDVLDPLHGIEVSSCAAFLSLFAGAAFLASDGLVTVVQTLRLSYLRFDAGAGVDWLAFGSLLGTLLSESLRLSAPVVASMFITELLLGVLSRFATQMGVFSLAFSIKSIVSFTVFYLYFGPTFEHVFKLVNVAAMVPVLRP